MLGDHYPVSVTFQMGSKIPTGIATISSAKDQVPSYYDLQGRRVNGNARGIVIERSGENIHKRIIK
jgi:hypothetical protein